jgi:RNA polymerase subunit RPABC4/transcription elongation factor Spt4
MAEFAKRAVISGATTVAEIQRVILSDESVEQMCPGCSQVVSIDFAVCPFCQHVLKEQCHGCGNPLEESWDACPHCGLEVHREDRQSHCPRCLAPVEAAWSDCPFCGGSLS